MQTGRPPVLPTDSKKWRLNSQSTTVTNLNVNNNEISLPFLPAHNLPNISPNFITEKGKNLIQYI